MLKTTASEHFLLQMILIFITIYYQAVIRQLFQEKRVRIFTRRDCVFYTEVSKLVFTLIFNFRQSSFRTADTINVGSAHKGKIKSKIKAQLRVQALVIPYSRVVRSAFVQTSSSCQFVHKLLSNKLPCPGSLCSYRLQPEHWQKCFRCLINITDYNIYVQQRRAHGTPKMYV